MKFDDSKLIIGDVSSDPKIILIIGDYDAPKTEIVLDVLSKTNQPYCYFYTEGAYDGEFKEKLTPVDIDFTLQNINDVISENDNLEGILIIDSLSAFTDNNISRIRKLTTLCRDKDLTLVCTMHKGRITPIDTNLAVLFDAIYFCGAS